MEFIERAKKDLEYIFRVLSSKNADKNAVFAEKVNFDLERNIDKDEKTENVIGLKSYDSVKVNEGKNRAVVKINGVGDSYWLVDGEESALPGEVEKNCLLKNKELFFKLVYELVEGKWLLILVEDGSGMELGKLTGKPWGKHHPLSPIGLLKWGWNVNHKYQAALPIFIFYFYLMTIMFLVEVLYEYFFNKELSIVF